MANWEIGFHPEFEIELSDLPQAIQDELFARLAKLAEFGPDLGRPDVDTLQESSFQNMKELRFQLDGLGGSPSLLTQNVERSFWWEAISKASGHRVFMAG